MEEYKMSGTTLTYSGQWTGSNTVTLQPGGSYIVGQNQAQPSQYFIQQVTAPDPDWLSNFLYPIGLFSIELSIALLIAASAACAVSYFHVFEK